jgi:tRNA-Thr(GGU) m(6)t(6)A37 methyltransferase TsaA
LKIRARRRAHWTPADAGRTVAGARRGGDAQRREGEGMGGQDRIRRGEVTTAPPAATDAGLAFIGRIRTPWSIRSDCPRQGRTDGPLCRIEVFPPWDAALAGIEAHARLDVLYWLHEARRDMLRQSPRDDGATLGTFALRSPLRPNPIGLSTVALERVEGATLFVRGLDCLDGTPLLDMKPHRDGFAPLAPPTPGDAMTG